MAGAGGGRCPLFCWSKEQTQRGCVRETEAGTFQPKPQKSGGRAAKARPSPADALAAALWDVPTECMGENPERPFPTWFPKYSDY